MTHSLTDSFTSILKDDEKYQLYIWNSGSYNDLDVRQEESVEHSTSLETWGYNPPTVNHVGFMYHTSIIKLNVELFKVSVEPKTTI